MRFLILLFLVATSSLFAQDVINFKDGTSIDSKVLEIGDRVITYNRWDNLTGPLFKVDKKRVSDVIFQNGTTWVSDSPKTLTESFAEHREKVKQLELINDSLDHHVLSFGFSVPEVGFNESFFAYLSGGFFYEFQSRGKRFGLRSGVNYGYQIGPMRLVPRNKGWIGGSLSPRYYVKNWASSQVFVGTTFELGSHLTYQEGIWINRDDPHNKQTVSNNWYSIMSGCFISVGGHVTSKSKFNISLEGIIGVRYLTYKWQYVDNPNQQLNPIEGSFESEIQPTLGLRLGFGRRFKK